MFQDGKPLSRESFIQWLKKTLVAAGMDTSKFSGHSFHIGAASVAAARGVEDSIIQTLMGWSIVQRFMSCVVNVDLLCAKG